MKDIKEFAALIASDGARLEALMAENAQLKAENAQLKTALESAKRSDNN